MAEMNGYIKLHRQLIESPVFQNEKLLKVWIWCLLKASHTPHEEIIGHQIIQLEAGQFVFGSIKSADALGLPRSTFNRCMNSLQKFKMLDIKTNNKFSVATIENWGKFQAVPLAIGQADGQQTDNKRTANGQQTDTNKNDKNDKKEKNVKYNNILRHKYGEYDNVLLTDAELEKLKTEFPLDYEERIERLSSYIASTGRRYKSHYATIRNWAKRETPKKGNTLEDSYKMMGEWANG